MIAFYDLQYRHPTYDFFTWLVHVKLLGAVEIVFPPLETWKFLMRKKWPREETLRRLDNFLYPGAALAGLPWRTGSEGERHLGSHLYIEVWRDMQKLGCGLPRLRSVLPPGNVRHTVTIRETFYLPYRNSDPDLWRLFGERIGARVIEDTMRQDIGLYERMSLYAGAEMNWGIPNGPLSMLYLTPYPLTEFCDPHKFRECFSRQHIPLNDQIPWFLPKQKLVWQKPTMDSLMREFERQQEKTAA